MHSKPVECNRTTFRGASAKEIGKAAKELYRALFPASRAGGKRDEPAVIRNRDGEYIRMPVSAAKELVRHSAENSTLQLIPNLKELIAKSVFLYEDAKDPDRVKKLNQSTALYRYYGMKIKLDGKECFARIVVREEANGRKYFYDGDITEIKKALIRPCCSIPKTSHSLIRASLSIVYRNGWQKSKKLPIKSGKTEKS